MMSESIPGSCGCPVVSDKSYEFVMDPVKFVESRIRQHSSKIFQARVLNNPTVFVCSPLLIKEMLAGANCNDFEHGYRSILHHVFGDMIIFENEIEALHLRGCLAPLFEGVHPQTTNKFRGTFFASLGGRNVAVYSEFKTLMTRMCLELFLNMDDDTPDDVIDEISELATQHWHGMISVPVRVNLPFGARSSFSLAVQARDQLLLLIRHILAKHSINTENENPDSLFSRLRGVAFPKSNDLEQHLLLFVSALIPKAFSSLITSFLLATAGDDKKTCRAKARNSDEYLDDVLFEVERLWPPLFGGRRLARRSTKLANHKIPKDYAIFYITYSAHRDPDIFPNPNTFDPDRWTTWKWQFLQARNICLFGLFYYSVTLSYNQEERKRKIKETKELICTGSYK